MLSSRKVNETCVEKLKISVAAIVSYTHLNFDRHSGRSLKSKLTLKQGEGGRGG